MCFVVVPFSKAPADSQEVEIKTPGLPWRLSDKESTYNAREAGSIPGSGGSLEEEMASHSSILARRIPWTEEPGGLHTVHGVAESDTAKCTHRDKTQSLEVKQSVKQPPSRPY